ncbi:MAG TPA: NUDIX domain-containing protein [Candidatus Saccharimonadales bacterium]
MPEHRLWKHGPNYAADAVVFNGEKLLLIQRSSDDWALPGGFVDDSETPLQAARREVLEETGFIVVEAAAPVYTGRVNDPRADDERWIETTAYLFEVNSGCSVQGNDDAKDARWWPLDELPPLYGSHQVLVERALLRRELMGAETEDAPGGHMGYDYRLHQTTRGSLFSKQHVPNRYATSKQANDARRYLSKEAGLLQHLAEQRYEAIPAHATHFDDLLVLEGLPTHEGWHWRAPREANERERYIQDVLTSLTNLEQVDAAVTDTITPSIISFMEEGWDALAEPDVEQQVDNIITRLLPSLQPATAEAASQLLAHLPELIEAGRALEVAPTTSLAHHDARQANVAWHPKYGVKIVDWSWAGPGMKRADTTAFLVDLAKSGHDVSPYLADYFNPAYARLLIGFWLGHSVRPARPGYESVRLHQVASAATAYKLVTADA